MKTELKRGMEFGLFGMMLAAMILTATTADAAPYTWNVTGGGNWADNAKWNPSGNYPKAGDDASFTGTLAQVVNVANSGPQAVRNVDVSGSAQWTWDVAGSVGLAISGTFTYGSSNTNSVFNAPLTGSGSLVVNGGQVYLKNIDATTPNSFSGIVVNAGTLASGGTVEANTNIFGNPYATIYVGATSGASADATVRFGNKYASTFSYTQPIVIRSGNSGRATLSYVRIYWLPYGTRLSGGITLQKDVHLAGDGFVGGAGWSAGGNSQGNLEVNSAIVGAGNVYLDDIYNIVLSGTNSYLGQTIVNGNQAWMNSSANTYTGAITIARGSLYATTDGALGAPQNVVTMGGPGTLGLLGMNGSQWALVPYLHATTLAGNGGFISSWNNVRPALYGNITGPGRLILAHSQDPYTGIASMIYGTNDYSGGTLAVDGMTWAGTNTAFGKGNIEVKIGGYLGLYAATNVAPGAKILVKRNPLMDHCGKSGGDLGLYADFVPNIATNSNGKLAINFSGSTNVNAWLQNGSQPIGDGTMFLGSWNNSTISATGLAALVANDPTHTYKLGTSYSDLTLDSSNTTVGALADIGGQPYNVQVGRPNVGGTKNSAVIINDDERFSGILTIWPGAYVNFQMFPGASANCAGATNGNIVLYGHRDDNTAWKSLWIMNNANVTRTVNKNDLQVNGSAYLLVDNNYGVDRTTTVQVATLTRNGKSTLSVRGNYGLLGSGERFFVTNGVTTNNGMAAPWLWNDLAGSFLNYGATGFITNLWDATTLASATGVSKVKLSATEQIAAGGVALYALSMSNCCVLANGGAVLTNNSGGVMLLGAGTTNEPPMDFGTNEAVVIARNNSSTHFFNGSLKGSGGLTKTGKGALALNADNTAFTGGFVVNQGELSYTNWMHLGNNTITLNGGALMVRGALASPGPSITNNIILGPCGGILGNNDPNNGGYGRSYGSISGTGFVRIQPGYGYWLYGVSSYSGGTFMEGLCALYLYTNNAVGTGPVCMGFGGNGTTMGNQNWLFVMHDRALNTNSFIELKTRTSQLMLQSANPLLGSVEGNGFITLGAGPTLASSRATFGLDNRDAEYFGQIDQYSNPTYPGYIIKDGTGTWTLWGMVTVNGSLSVTNGTLLVNNWVNPAAPVSVYPGATLGGIGSVGTVSNLGGTVQGSLYINQLVMNSASKLNVTLGGTNAVSQYGQLHIANGLTLGGSTLNLSLSNFKPSGGQTFTILSNSGTASGTQFSCGQIVTATSGGKTYSFRVSYVGGAGGDVVLTAMPSGTVVFVR